MINLKTLLVVPEIRLDDNPAHFSFWAGILALVPELDMIVIGEGEETFSELYDEIDKKTFDFDKVKGLCLNKNGIIKFKEPRALISDLNTIPYPAYHLLEMEIYFSNSSLPLSVEAYNAKRRASVVWERGCPRSEEH